MLSIDRLILLGRVLWRWATYSYTYRFIVWARHHWRERLTKPGQYLIAAAITSVIAGSFPEIMAGSFTFSFFVALVLLSLLITSLRKPRVQVIRTVPERCVAGASVPLRITVRNPARRWLADIGAFEFRLPEALRIAGDVHFIPTLGPGQAHTFEYALLATRRGSYNLPGPTALSTFPFGLAQARRFFADARRLVVYPPFHPLRKLDLPVSQRYQPGGIVLTSNVGESMEFIGNREYRPGDRMRDLHPRSWARVGYPVVKQYQEEFLTRVAILLDTFVPGRAPSLRRRPSPDDPLEANLSLAAAIADYLARQEYIVNLFAAGPELYYFQAGRSLGFVDNILDILACIERCPTDPLETIGPRFNQELMQISTVIVLLLDWEPKRQAFVESVRRAGVRVKPILISDRHTLDDLAGAGHAARVVTPRQVTRGIDSL